ncbi:MAG: phosphotransferase family protein [Sulfurovum sp.]|nr:phosphotransferase family protein [Sulfurovum sp.]
MLKIIFKGKNIENLQRLPDQGFSNINYTFTFKDTTYLLRQFKLQDRDRQLEFDIQTLVYKEELAAKPYDLNLSDGYMICEFLDGHHKEKLERNDIAQMTHVLKKLHSLTIKSQMIDLKSEFKIQDKALSDAFLMIDSTEREIVLCHNDLNPKNCIFSDKSLKLIDWEFAGMNDRYFDLAALSVEFNFELIDDAYLLASYFGREGWNKKKFDAYKVIYKTLCEKWFKENT